MADSENVSRLRELAVYGKEYRETNEYEYLGAPLELCIGPLDDQYLIPFLAVLEERFGMDIEDAEEEIEEARDEDGDIDASEVDAEFVRLMADAAIEGIDTSEADAEGEDEEGLREIFGISDDDEANIGLVGGMTLEIAQDVLSISEDADAAEKFRR